MAGKNKPNSEGIVAFVSNNNFIDGIAFDGMRKNLEQDFNRIYVLDLKGNIRKDSMRDGIPLGEKHTIFGLASMVGVTISFLIKGKHFTDKKIFYSTVDFRATRAEKFDLIERCKTIKNIKWEEIIPDKNHTWLTGDLQSDFETFLPFGTKEAKAGKGKAIFKNYGRGVATGRDAWAYNFDKDEVSQNIKRMIEAYNDHIAKWDKLIDKPDVNDFVEYDDAKISWSRDLKLDLKRGKIAEFKESKIRHSVYRPFVKKHLFFDKILNEEVYQFPRFFPTPETEIKNRVICLRAVGCTKPFHCLMTNAIPDLPQCFPFYTYNEDGKNRQENITRWALKRFRKKYDDDQISKWDIFHYIYAVLHHPRYHEKYGANLRRELPRIPLISNFWGFAEAGAKLAELHVHYEDQPEYSLKLIENKDLTLDWKVEKMKLSKEKTDLQYNDFLTLGGVPPEVFEYRLGNRSALEWIIDQYRVKTDKRSGLVNDPNRHDDQQYIVRLIGQVITVSLETVKIVNSLPDLE